jgi:hypothetical protein
MTTAARLALARTSRGRFAARSTGTVEQLDANLDALPIELSARQRAKLDDGSRPEPVMTPHSLSARFPDHPPRRPTSRDSLNTNCGMPAGAGRGRTHLGTTERPDAGATVTVCDARSAA